MMISSYVNFEGSCTVAKGGGASLTAGLSAFASNVPWTLALCTDVAITAHGGVTYFVIVISTGIGGLL